MRRFGMLGLVLLAACGEDRLAHTAMGVLKVNVLNAGSAERVELTLRCTSDERDEKAPVAVPSLVMEVGDLLPGTCQARVVTRATSNAVLRSIWVSDLLIASGRTTEITVDMADRILPPEVKELCNGWDDDGDGIVDKPKEKLLLCSECVRELESPAVDDDRCPVVRCPEYSYELRGNAANGWSCLKHSLQDITTQRCAGLGKCLEASEQTCREKATKLEDLVLSVEATDVCRKIDGCSGQIAPVVVALADGTSCLGDKVCKAGECVCKASCEGKTCGDDGCGDTCGSCKPTETCSPTGTCTCQPQCTGKTCGDDGCGGSCGTCKPTETCSASTHACEPLLPETGCADGDREGFLSLTEYPSIASCSGGWSVGGVTRADLVSTCGRQAGNSGANKEGTGCSSADLCAAGWHVCNGKTEVAAKAGAKGCQDSVPAGSPEKAMFFAVAQHSVANSVCDDTVTADNDVFGCGNLGIVLTAAKGCGVLTRALASMTPQTCGYTEAEPKLGPWECKGDATSHLHEGGLVTKKGCASQSCTWESSPTGNWDRGGVLCCRD